MRKKFVALCILVGLALSACGGGNKTTSEGSKTATVGEPVEIVISHIVDENHTWHKGAEKFKEVAEEKSGGRLKVSIYPNSQLGNEIDTIQSILTGGGCDITFTAESMQTYAEELGVIGMPYAIKSEKQLYNVLDGEVGKEMEDIMLKSGMRVLGYFVRGPRNITSNTPIKTPDDLKGFIIRTPQSPMTVAAFEAMGAKPTPMAFSEVFTSLQQGVINGQENPLAMIKSGSLYEVQKYVNQTEHLRAWVYIAMGEKKYQSLPDDLKEVVNEAAKEAQKYEHELFLEDEKKLKGELQEKGMEFVDVDQKLFAEKAVPGVEAILTEKQKALYDKIKAVEE